MLRFSRRASGVIAAVVLLGHADVAKGAKSFQSPPYPPDLAEQEKLRHYLVSMDPAVSAEQATCHGEFIEKFHASARAKFQRQGAVIYQSKGVVLAPLYWPFAWFQKSSAVRREDGKAGGSYQFVENNEYKVIRFSAWILEAPYFLPARVEVDYPIHLYGRVMRNDAKKTDQAEMRWTLESAPVDVIAVDLKAPLFSEMRRAIDPKAKVRLQAPYETSEELKLWTCRPKTRRGYELGTGKPISGQ